jgi:hypothetical protein
VNQFLVVITGKLVDEKGIDMNTTRDRRSSDIRRIGALITQINDTAARARSAFQRGDLPEHNRLWQQYKSIKAEIDSIAPQLVERVAG